MEVDIYDCITEKSLDFLLIKETWLRDRGNELAITEMTPHGYTFSHRPRVSGRDGGSTFIYRKCIIVKTLSVTNFESFENIGFPVSHGKQTVRVICLLSYPLQRKTD